MKTCLQLDRPQTAPASCPSTFTGKKFSHHGPGLLQPLLLTKKRKVMFTLGMTWGFSRAGLRGFGAVSSSFGRADEQIVKNFVSQL